MDPEAIVAQTNEFFTEEALRSQDGKKVPVRSSPGGPTIGEAIMWYDPDEKALKARFEIKDPDFRQVFIGDPALIFAERNIREA